ncbi:UDP-N-acetylglucosamine--LPS N-acetylglucosamine transferase [[Phormidium ambiguum] IAM M-71]|uniref:UDP-N-acetylglucosamine--LPS N-acetylglucosamine transferase n=1 Tax=[Phormidium ambiguum] IAM M-71 TaxID=454136 RepID=A0A1U7I8M2_9CYAN|nr:glycosyltransferase [Phormidium ambiguum]OKH32739.1 UDP-N-acetylglucosamine--LPS N-acetylglucosamine transferase [Phormidium ambiguum IAM M-71]
MRVMILYASLGMGHISAANALSQAFSCFRDIEVLSEDALAYASSVYRNAVIQAYKNSSEKVPQLYKALYEGSDISDLERSLDSNLAWAKLELPFFRRLGRLIRETAPDAIVCVQQIPSRLLQLLEPEDQVSKPQYVVVTDLIAHSTWLNYGVDGYFLPNDLSANILKQRGVNPALLHITGIPVKLEITKPKSSGEMRSRHHLPKDLSVVTLFGGGLNSRRVYAIVSSLLETLNSAMIVVVAGRNEDLLDTLSDLTDSPHVRLRKLGTIDYVDDLIVASDLIITKAGGLITSEILARGTPTIIVDPLPGQEEQNADVIAAAGAGVQLRLLEMVAPAVKYLLNHPDRLNQMRQSALEIGQPKAALNIAERILSDWRSRTKMLQPSNS